MRQRLDSYHDMCVGMVLPSKLQEHINYSTQVQSPSLVISDLDCSGSSVVPTVRLFQQHHNAWPPQPSQAWPSMALTSRRTPMRALARPLWGFAVSAVRTHIFPLLFQSGPNVGCAVSRVRTSDLTILPKFERSYPVNYMSTYWPTMEKSHTGCPPPAWCIVKYFSQKQNESNDKNQWYIISLNLVF